MGTSSTKAGKSQTDDQNIDHMHDKDFTSWDPIPENLQRKPSLAPRRPYSSPYLSRIKRIRDNLCITKEWLRKNKNQSIISSFSYSKEEDDKDWLFTLKGPPGTPYEGGEYKMIAFFLTLFPAKSIELVFIKPFPYASNVCQSTGYVLHGYRGGVGCMSVVEKVEKVVHTVFCRGTVHTPSLSRALSPFFCRVHSAEGIVPSTPPKLTKKVEFPNRVL